MKAPNNQFKVFRRRATSRRAGISLLEILISIGVVGIGLVGVAALIPLAHHKATQGVTRDRMGTFGRRVFREFSVRGYDRPGDLAIPGAQPRWLTIEPSPFNVVNVYYPTGVRPVAPHPDAFDPSYQPGMVRPQVFCFDPLGVADRFNLTGANDVVDRFPSIPQSQLGSLPPEVQQLTVARVTIANPSSVPPSPIPMSYLEAEQKFSLADDLEFAIPSDHPDWPRTQQYRATASLPQAKRFSNGDFSWMATLVPDTQPVFIPGSPVLRYYPNSGGRYRMSVIIFNRRTSYSRLLTAGPNAANRVINQEILAEVYLPGGTFTTPGNASTKEIHIRSAFPYRSSDDAALQPNDIAGATWADVNVGSWIALLQFEGGSRPAKNLSWFQVTSATDLPANGEFVFSLKGPDWNFDVQTYAIYVNDVVSVFEKTIRLHESSAYAN